MDSTQVTAAQADTIANRVAPMLGFVTRLRDRMQKRGWPGSDPVYADVKAAHEALRRLHITLRELARLQQVASQDRRPWEPGGAGREGR